MSTILGRPITMGGSGKLPDIFGDGSDGDLVIKAGETVTLPVAVPHQSVIEKNYASITIEAGGTLTTADYNAGLVLRCQGDCNISGTISQKGKGPKTNPDNSYQYPAELVCGKGGDGGDTGTTRPATGGTGMPGRPYGGGISGGGAGYPGTAGYTGAAEQNAGGAGGSADQITVGTPDSQMFVGATGNERPGSNGGGGSGGHADWQDDDYGYGGNGGSGPGGSGQAGGTESGARGGRGGGAGNYGGGVVLLYVGGNLYFEGSIDCSGLPGGSPNGGGGGGGAVYIVYNGTQTVTGSFDVSGGASGGGNGEAGGVGTTTVKEYERGMTA